MRTNLSRARRRNFIHCLVVGLGIASGVGSGADRYSSADVEDCIKGIDLKQLAAIRAEDLRRVTFNCFAKHPCIEPKKSSPDEEQKKWAQVMSALFPEGPDELKRRGWAKEVSGGNLVLSSTPARLRLAAAHLFSIRGSAVDGSRDEVGLYAQFLASIPFDETLYPGETPHELVLNFFNSGGHPNLIRGAAVSVETAARSWETDTGIKLKGGSTLEGVTILLSIQTPEVCSPYLGGVRMSLICRQANGRDLVPHAKGFMDMAMMKEAVRAKFKATSETKPEWQREFRSNLIADLRRDAKTSPSADALEAVSNKKVMSDESLLDAILGVVSESLVAQAYPADLKFINRLEYGGLLLDSPLSEPPPQFPGYKNQPLTREIAAVNATLAVKCSVVARALNDTEMAAWCKNLQESYLTRSGLQMDDLRVFEGVFGRVFEAFGLRRGELLEVLKARQNALESGDTAQRLKAVRDGREAYLSNMACWSDSLFYGSAYEGFLYLQKASRR